jgi:hypothetical protein
MQAAFAETSGASVKTKASSREMKRLACRSMEPSWSSKRFFVEIDAASLEIHEALAEIDEAVGETDAPFHEVDGVVVYAREAFPQTARRARPAVAMVVQVCPASTSDAAADNQTASARKATRGP